MQTVLRFYVDHEVQVKKAQTAFNAFSKMDRAGSRGELESSTR